MVFPLLEEQDFNSAQAPMLFGKNMLSLYTACCRLRRSPLYHSLSLGAPKVITNTELMEQASNHKYILEGSEVRAINNTKLVEGGTRMVLS